MQKIPIESLINYRERNRLVCYDCVNKKHDKWECMSNLVSNLDVKSNTCSFHSPRCWVCNKAINVDVNNLFIEGGHKVHYECSRDYKRIKEYYE